MAEEVERTAAVMRGVLELIVTQPADVRVEIDRLEGCTVVDLRVAEKDVGRVIGRGGRTADALRVILKAAERDGERYQLNINDGDSGGKR